MASLAVISVLSDYPYLVSTIYEYGKKNLWIYNNTNYTKFFDKIKWTIKCYRHPRETIFYKACAGAKLNFIERKIIEISILGTLVKKPDKKLHPHQNVPGMFVKNGKKYIGDYYQVSGRLMAWRKLVALTHLSPSWLDLENKWTSGMIKKYGASWFSIIHSIYFDERFTGHEKHPFVMILDAKRDE
jgi:hypothetical protein